MCDALAGEPAFSKWSNGPGRSTVLSYAVTGEANLRDRIQERHGELLQRLLLWHEEPEAIFVHADVDRDVPMHLQRREVLLWRKTTPSESQNHISGKTVVCGHTPLNDGKPVRCGNVCFIDTAIKHGGWLTCLDVLSQRCWQARDNGDHRCLTLHPMKATDR